MPATFVTYFGSQLLGMKVTWDNTTAANLVMTMNVYSYAKPLIAGWDTVGDAGAENNGLKGSMWTTYSPLKCDSTVS